MAISFTFSSPRTNAHHWTLVASNVQIDRKPLRHPFGRRVLMMHVPILPEPWPIIQRHHRKTVIEKPALAVGLF
jgi:hypothetical protein